MEKEVCARVFGRPVEGGDTFVEHCGVRAQWPRPPGHVVQSVFRVLTVDPRNSSAPKPKRKRQLPMNQKGIRNLRTAREKAAYFWGLR